MKLDGFKIQIAQNEQTMAGHMALEWLQDMCENHTKFFANFIRTATDFGKSNPKITGAHTEIIEFLEKANVKEDQDNGKPNITVAELLGFCWILNNAYLSKKDFDQKYGDIEMSKEAHEKLMDLHTSTTCNKVI